MSRKDEFDGEYKRILGINFTKNEFHLNMMTQHGFSKVEIRCSGVL